MEGFVKVIGYIKVFEYVKEGDTFYEFTNIKTDTYVSDSSILKITNNELPEEFKELKINIEGEFNFITCKNVTYAKCRYVMDGSWITEDAPEFITYISKK